MDSGGILLSGTDISSLMSWWNDAGVDTFVDEAPRNWLAPAIPAASPAIASPPIASPIAAPTVQPVAQPRPAAAKPAAALPETLPAFQQWLATSEQLALPMPARVAASGDAASGLMILVDLPDTADVEAGRLLAGEAGALFDRMIAAIGRGRETIYLAAMAPGRPSGGFVDAASGALYTSLARHHVMLAKPRALLLMGEAPSRAFLNLGFVEARGRQHDVALPGGATKAVATFHPRTLLQHPAQKKRAWEDLQMLMKIFE